MLWKNELIEFFKKDNPETLKTNLCRLWPEIHPEDREDIYRFLFVSGQHSLFVSFFSIDLKNQKTDSSWMWFLEIINIHKIPFPEDFLEEVVQSFKMQESANEGLSAEEDFSINGLIKFLKKKQRDEYSLKIQKLKEEIYESIKIAESERLEDQITHYLNELKKISPDSFESSSTLRTKEREQVQRVLKKLKARKRKVKRSFKRVKYDEPKEEEKNLMKSIEHQVRLYHSQGKAKASDFAYLLRSLGETSLSVDFMHKEKDNCQKDWLLLDYLFFGDQYLSILDHCDFLKEKYANEPDALFPVFYAEALAFWELGEKERALDIMSQISQIRPSFKSASKILSQWKEELFE